jgi:hypothetical protein
MRIATRRLGSVLAAILITAWGGGIADEIPSGDDVSVSVAAYIFLDDAATGDQFAELLQGVQIATSLVPLDQLEETALSGFDLVLIGADTAGGDINPWSLPGPALTVARSGLPVVAVGAGGLAFLRARGLVDLDSIQGDDNAATIRVADRDLPIYAGPQDLSLPENDLLTLFDAEVPVSYLKVPHEPPERLALARHPTAPGLAPLFQQDVRFSAWLFNGAPSEMTDAGRALFQNLAHHALQAIGNVDTLILTNYQRMIDIGYTQASVSALANKIQYLVSLAVEDSRMTAITRDLSMQGPPSVTSAYAAWVGDEGDVTKTNALARAIRKYIRTLRKGTYYNLRYVALVGSYEVIPMEARKVESGVGQQWSEHNWAGYSLPATSVLYEILRTTQNNSPWGYFPSDLIYRNWSAEPGIKIYKDPYLPIDDEYMPEFGVGRLVETPDQIVGMLNAYLSRKGALSRGKMAVIASQDGTKLGWSVAKSMGPAADTSLVRDCKQFGENQGNCFPSSLVPPMLNARHDVVFLSGHANPNSFTTQKWHHSFRAGPDSNQGDLSEVNPMPGGVVVGHGCHSGLNVGNKLRGLPHMYDFPEEFAAKQVAAYLGVTTYGHTVCCSTRIAALYTDKLLNEGDDITTGGAHLEAVKQYYSDSFPPGIPPGQTDDMTRYIAATTLYAMPTWGWGPTLRIAPPPDYGLGKVWVCPGCPIQPPIEDITWKLKKYGLLPDGRVWIEGASYGSGGGDYPILPRVTHSRILPMGAAVSEVEWDPLLSESVTISNDVPLDTAIRVNETLDGVVSLDTGVFDYDGFYPPEPFTWSVGSRLSGGAVETRLVIYPVQYSPSTHETRIWTKLAFTVTYEADAAGLVRDGDGDGLPDYWEAGHGLDRHDPSGSHGPDGDPDGDELVNARELEHGTDPRSADSDRDGLADGDEDADLDGVVDPGETSPWSPDSDGDGYVDGEELVGGGDPLDPDSRPASLVKILLEGPDPVGIALSIPTTYVFQLSYSSPDPPRPVRIRDTVPAEFEVVDVHATAGEAHFFETRHGGGGGKPSATRVEWDLASDEPAGTLMIEARTVRSPGRGHREPVYKPTSCGPVLLNDGATAYELDPLTGRIVDVEVTDPVTGEVAWEPSIVLGPSNSLEIEAVEGSRACD